MKKLISTAGIIALAVAGVGGIVGIADVAEAGDAPAPAPPPADFVVVYQAFGDAAEEIVDEITPQLFEADGTTVVTGCTSMETNAGQSLQYTCADLPTGVPTGIDYVVGIDDVPLSATVDGVSCGDPAPDLGLGVGTLSLESDFPSARRAHSVAGSICTVFLETNPSIGIDTVVVGGTATFADFSYDILDETDAVIATGVTDSNAAGCPGTGMNNANCSSTLAPPGSYSIRANTSAPSYVVTGFECDGEPPASATELGDFGHSSNDNTDTRCIVTWTYATQEIRVDIDVTNDDGGTATAADFTIEIRDATDTIVATGTDPEPGVGNASAVFTVPLGEYTVTVSGPDGYTVTVETTVVDRDADLAAIDLFTVDLTQTNNAIVRLDDDPPPTTTTIAPTTTMNPVDILPATGSSDSTLPLLALAGMLVLAGGGAVAATRRR